MDLFVCAFFFSSKDVAAVYFPQESLYANATSVKDDLLSI